MSRRTSLLDDLMEIAARLPWFVSLGLAGTLYVALRLFVTAAGSPVANVADLGTFAARQVGRSIAAILQYVLPLVFLFGAAGSVVRRRRDAVRLTDAAADPGAFICSLSWQDFERLVGGAFERQGFAVTHTGAGCADGGVDLVLKKGRESTLVQCKLWRAQKVGVSTVRELYGVMAARGAAHGIVVTAGDFTRDAGEFAAGRNIELLNGTALAGMIGTVDADERAKAAATAPKCPRCGARMIERVARQGPSAGGSFWGCETFPRCRGTLPIT